jgi:hypothetical protein
MRFEYLRQRGQRVSGRRICDHSHRWPDEIAAVEDSESLAGNFVDDCGKIPAGVAGPDRRRQWASGERRDQRR